ncbi:MAG TPA: NAD(P)-binding domain-containing protein [Thermoleophilia bacterium]|nr:NAD(P)-binding domain-containing protein [Thermoleophilia bacterium]
MTTVAIIGQGNVGSTLARKWAVAGHALVLGTRDPAGERPRALAAELGAAAKVATVADAVRDADVVVFAIPGAGMVTTVPAVAAALGGKVVVDATNTMGAQPLHSVDLITGAAPTAHVFRAFSTLGWENFADPVIGGVQADLFYAGPEGDADAVVSALIADVGLRPVRVGDRAQLDLVENLAALWFALALHQGRGRHLAFRMISD